MPAIVFVTAHDLYAVKAFDVSALDFLLKPVDPQRLAVTIDRLRRHRLDRGARRRRPRAAGRRRAGQRPAAGRAQQRIHLRIDGKSVIAPLGTVAMLAAEADFTRVFLKGARDYLVCRLLRHFEAQLPTPPVRPHQPVADRQPRPAGAGRLAGCRALQRLAGRRHRADRPRPDRGPAIAAEPRCGPHGSRVAGHSPTAFMAFTNRASLVESGPIDGSDLDLRRLCITA